MCPMCTTPRSPGAAFCEACRYDFRSKLPFSGLDALPQGNPSAVLEQSGPTAGADAANAAASGFLAAPPNSAAPASQVPAPMPAQATTTLSLRLRVTVDPTLSTVEEQGGACPVGQSDRVFFLDLPENTLGRRNAGGDVHTEIVVDDPGISRRHVRFIVADGQCEVVDLNSANGTHLNEQVLQPGDLKPIKPGDVLTLGFWTRAFVEAR